MQGSHKHHGWATRTQKIASKGHQKLQKYFLVYILTSGLTIAFHLHQFTC